MNMKITKNLLLLAICLVTSSATFAQDKAKDYDAGYYENSGDLLFKVFATYSKLNSDLKKLPEPTNSGVSKPSELAKNGYGINASTTYFFAEHIAAELSTGVSQVKVKASTINNIYNAYKSRRAPAAPAKNKSVYSIPMIAMLQYHIAPYGGFRPYLGLGYHWNYFLTRSSAMKLSIGHGAVLQAGVDLFAKDDTFITIDVKKYLLKTKVAFLSSFLGTSNDLKSQIQLNSTSVSLGIGFRL